ncbi:hypothetical protein GCM10007103_30880 [Salinimicrobium marinum]|uniref:Outer membrane protein beta-barrel domain-containing protein n=1 Tax=Salinimicrobium marinum TaxID=680283 RepID=A0A918W1L6_9FLAO|nr:hypothetical protein [Salinimicrobium marinum]GHA47681.1 hypothetical protein GCM10007103_30880 [Salinimicrobium marinum]
METTINTVYKRLSIFKILIITITIISSGKIYCQSKNEFSVHFKGPFSTLYYEHNQDEQGLENGLGLGINYHYYLDKNWSLATGVEIQSLEGSVHYDSIEGAYQTVDVEGEEFEFRYKLQNFAEEQSAYYLNIPVRAQYESMGRIRFFAAGGVKVGFKVKSEYESDVSSLTTSGYYEQYDAELTGPEFMGFGQFEEIENGKKSLDLKTNYMMDLESGVKLLLDNDRFFYMGLFLDYGLSGISENNSENNLLIYNSEDPTSFSTKSILSTTGDEKNINKVRTVAYGLKIRYAIRF